MFPLPGCNMGRQDPSKSWGPVPGGGCPVSGAPRGFGGAGAEVDEETKKKQNIINIVREGQISLLVSVTHSGQWKSWSWTIHLFKILFNVLYTSCFIPVSSSSNCYRSLTWLQIIWSLSEMRMATTCCTSRPLRDTLTVCSTSPL